MMARLGGCRNVGASKREILGAWWDSVWGPARGLGGCWCFSMKLSQGGGGVSRWFWSGSRNGTAVSHGA